MDCQYGRYRIPPEPAVSEGEFEDVVETQDVECPLAFHSYCTHCDTEGIVNALIRDGRQVYALILSAVSP